jgi:hypothetical protein
MSLHHEMRQRLDAVLHDGAEIGLQSLGHGVCARQPAPHGAVVDANVMGEGCLPARTVEGFADGAEGVGGHLECSQIVAPNGKSSVGVIPAPQSHLSHTLACRAVFAIGFEGGNNFAGKLWPLLICAAEAGLQSFNRSLRHVGLRYQVRRASRPAYVLYIGHGAGSVNA